jgi:cytidine deaminase
MKSYSPYSGIEETCFVKGKSGMHYPGVRVENISFPLSISAVQAAICSCLANGDLPASVYQLSSEPELFSHWVDEFELNVFTSEPDTDDFFDPLIEPPGNIRTALKKLTQKSVTTHSGFPVSALLNVGVGYIEGVNIETKIWSLGLCAERVAIARAVAAGYTDFQSIHVYAPKGDFCSPCGACRQVLSEFMPNSVAELHHGDGTLSKHNVAQLLPFGFTTSSLKR